MREFLKSFFSFGLATTIQKVIAFLLLPIYTRYFSKAEFGIIDLIQTILGIACIFAVLQLETALQRYYYDYKGKIRKEFISTIFIVILFFSVVVTIFLFFFSNPLSLIIFKSSRYSYLIKIASLQLPFTNFSMLAFVIFRYEKENVKFVLLMVLKVVLALFFVVLFVVIFKMGIEGIFYAQLISLFLSSTVLYVYLRKQLMTRFSASLFKKSFKYALPQIPARVGSVSLSYANRFFMLGYLTIASIGVYSLSLKIASAMQLVYSAFIMAWAPFMFERAKIKGHQELFAKILPLAGAPVLFLISAISLFSSEIVSIIGSREFHASYLYVGGLCFYFALLIFKEIVDIGPKIMEKTKYLSYTFFISVVVNLVALYFFIRYYGLEGVVFAMILTNIVLFAVSWLVSNKLYYVPFKMFKFALMAIPSLIISLAIMYVYPTIIVRVVILTIMLIFYGAIFWIEYTAFNNQKIYAGAK